MTEIRSARFLEFETIPEIVAETLLVNNSSVSGEFTANMNTTVTNTMSSGWHVVQGITVGQSIRYVVRKVGEKLLLNILMDGVKMAKYQNLSH